MSGYYKSLDVENLFKRLSLECTSLEYSIPVDKRRIDQERFSHLKLISDEINLLLEALGEKIEND